MMQRLIDGVEESGVVVSIVIPVYNEEKYIKNCIISLLKQDYSQVHMEWIFVDGNSGDKTLIIIEEFQKKYPELIKLYSNPNKTVPYAMNIGIKASAGKYIIRLDAHSEYAENYITRCVYYLDTIDADNVGGCAETKSRGYVGHAIACMLSSKFGVGNSHFRTSGKGGYVDTVPFGAFHREVFEKYGYYDDRLTRNQDNEMNYRIRKNGGKIYLAEDIKFAYYCRDSIKGIIDMAIQNGKWNIITMRLCPGAMGSRHFVPFIFLLSLITLPLLSIFSPFFKWVLLTEVIIYLILDLIFSLKAASQLKYAPLLFILFPLFHLSYGFGSLLALINPISSAEKRTA